MIRKSLTILSALFVVQTTVHADDNAARNIITAGGTLTEIVFALGAGDRVVAVDQSSTFPQKATQLPSVGYYRDLAAEGVLSVGANTLLALEGSGREAVLEQLKRIGVKVVLYDKPSSVDELVELVETLGRDLGRGAQAAQLALDIKASLPEKATSTKGKGLFLLSLGERGLVAAGEDTVPSLIFEYAGIGNPVKHTGYKAVNLETLTVEQPDFIIVPSHVARGLGGKEGICRQPSLALLNAAKSCNVLVIDGLMAMGMTPRLAQAISQVSAFSQQKS